MEVWIAFACGLLIGSLLGTLCLGLVGLNRTTRLWDELDIANNRVAVSYTHLRAHET